MVKELQSSHSVRVICEVVGIRSSSYYRWLKNQGKTTRQKADEELKPAIRK